MGGHAAPPAPSAFLAAAQPAAAGDGLQRLSAAPAAGFAHAAGRRARRTAAAPAAQRQCRHEQQPHPPHLRPGRRQLRPHRPAEGRRATRRRRHRRQSGTARLHRGAGVAGRIGLCGRRRPLLPGQHRRVPGHQDPGGRRDGAPDGKKLLRRHRPGHHRHGGQRPHHRGRHAAGGAGLLGGRRQQLVRGRRARPGAGEGLESRLRPLRRGLGRRRDPRAGRHRRGRAHRPGGLLHRSHQPQEPALGGRAPGPWRRHRAAGELGHPRQRPVAWRASWPSSCPRAT
jgi:hypothetical protein